MLRYFCFQVQWISWHGQELNQIRKLQEVPEYWPGVIGAICIYCCLCEEGVETSDLMEKISSWKHQNPFLMARIIKSLQALIQMSEPGIDDKYASSINKKNQQNCKYLMKNGTTIYAQMKTKGLKLYAKPTPVVFWCLLPSITYSVWKIPKWQIHLS